MSRFHFGIAGGVILITALHAQVAQAQLRAEPPAGQLRSGQRVLVDDGSCPAGQIKEVIGGNNLKTVNVGCGGLATVSRGGSQRQRRCIAVAGRSKTPVATQNTAPPKSNKAEVKKEITAAPEKSPRAQPVAAAADSGRTTFDARQFRRSATPFYWYTNCACGSFWKEKGEFDRALADCNDVIRLDPGYAAAYANRGDIWRLKGDLDQALNDQDQAIRLSPESIVFYIHRGDLLRYMGDLKRALAAYDQALRLDADYIPALYGQGLTYEKMGDLVRARVQFEKVLASKSKWAAQEIAKAARESALARLAALASGAPQPVIPPAPAKATNAASIPTPTVSAPAVEPTATADQGRRVALIIGNAAYREIAALRNPQRDAELIAAALRGIGFTTVKRVTNTTRAELLNALDAFASEAAKSDWAMVFYAGHGVEISGVNYLVPVDATLGTDRDVERGGVSLDHVMAAIGRAGKLKLVLLDACRDNPFLTPAAATAALGNTLVRVDAAPPPLAARSIGRGLGEITVQSGTLIVFAAKHGHTALDGDGGNSPFTVALAQRIATPSVEINKLFRLMRDDVMEATAGRQEPFTYGSLSGREDFFFVQR
jgi:tetratricopeptide (TPR) repeat protein